MARFELVELAGCYLNFLTGAGVWDASTSTRGRPVKGPGKAPGPGGP